VPVIKQNQPFLLYLLYLLDLFWLPSKNVDGWGGILGKAGKASKAGVLFI